MPQTNRNKAFEMAFSHYWEELYIQAFRKVQSEEIAKDLVQEVFVVLWNRLSRLPEDCSLKPYLYTILRYKTLKLFEKNEVRLQHTILLARQEVETDPSPHHLLLGRELEGIINEEVAKMPSRMQAIYLLRKNEQLSIREIARQLDLSEQTIKNQLQNAMQRLRERVQGYDPHLFY